MNFYDNCPLVPLFSQMHPWLLLWTTIKQQGRTQKQFALLVWKKVSEVNELIKGKRNITIQWDYLLHKVLWTPPKHRIDLQRDYDYEIFLSSLSTPIPSSPEPPKEQNSEEANEENHEPTEIIEDPISPEQEEIKEPTTFPPTDELLLQSKRQIFKDF